jgi:hypothetical protein
MEADEQVSKVSKIFEAFARALVKKENIKIEYLNEEGKITDFTFEINSGTPMFHLAINKNEYIEVINVGTLIFDVNAYNIQSITTFKTTELKFNEIKNI